MTTLAFSAPLGATAQRRAGTVAAPHVLDANSLGDHLDRLYRAALGLTGNAADAEDLVQDVCVRVLAKRPSDDYGELHGLYEPDEEITPARITAWMRTAQRKQVVAFKSFLRTLVHEFAHHLDYEHFKLPETFHTEGFYRRESSLANALLATLDPAAPVQSNLR